MFDVTLFILKIKKTEDAEIDFHSDDFYGSYCQYQCKNNTGLEVSEWDHIQITNFMMVLPTWVFMDLACYRRNCPKCSVCPCSKANQNWHDMNKFNGTIGMGSFV
jgi:hypothetical protein